MRCRPFIRAGAFLFFACVQLLQAANSCRRGRTQRGTTAPRTPRDRTPRRLTGAVRANTTHQIIGDEHRLVLYPPRFQRNCCVPDTGGIL